MATDPAWGGALVSLVSLAVGFALVTAISRASGWRELSDAYPSRGAAPSDRLLGSGVFRGWLGYNNAIFYATDASGLYMTALPVIMAKHAPIFIPWNELAIEEVRGLYGPAYRLRTAKAQRINFAIRGRVWPKLLPAIEAANVRIARQNS